MMPCAFASVDRLLNPVKHRTGAGLFFVLGSILYLSSRPILFLRVFSGLLLTQPSYMRSIDLAPDSYRPSPHIKSSDTIHADQILASTRGMHQKRKHKKDNHHSCCAVLEPLSPEARSRLLREFQECTSLLRQDLAGRRRPRIPPRSVGILALFLCIHLPSFFGSRPASSTTFSELPGLIFTRTRVHWSAIICLNSLPAPSATVNADATTSVDVYRAVLLPEVHSSLPMHTIFPWLAFRPPAFPHRQLISIP
jgi:hypothetical protein